jgi:glucose/arabinose dehydrogenase
VLAGALVVAVAATAVLVATRNDDGDGDGVLIDCGPEELATPELVPAAEGVPDVGLETVVADLDVTAMAARPDGRLLLWARTGQLVQVDPDTGEQEVLLDEDVPVSAETGALGAAISPDGGHLYLTYTPDLTGSRLVELPLTPEGVDVAGRRELLFQPNDQNRHLMSNLAFGPDGLLYVGVGDGANPPERAGQVNPAAQDPSDLAGSILRIDPRPDGDRPYTVPPDNPFVDTDGAAPEIFALGVRNPWRFSFDPATGDLWVGDAGEYCAEEISRIPADAQSGANLGWNTYEGPLRFDPDTDTPDAVAPVHWYQRRVGDPEAGVAPRCAVIGGVVYHGEALDGLQDRYVFGDHCARTVEVLDLDEEAGERSVQVLVELPAGLQGLAADADGELYALTNGGVFRLVPA